MSSAITHIQGSPDALFMITGISHLSCNASPTLWLLSADFQRQRSTEASTAPAKLSFPARGMLSRITAASLSKIPTWNSHESSLWGATTPLYRERVLTAKKIPQTSHTAFSSFWVVGTKSATGVSCIWEWCLPPVALGLLEKAKEHGL